MGSPLALHWKLISISLTSLFYFFWQELLVVENGRNEAALSKAV